MAASREYPAYPIPAVGVVIVREGRILLVQRGAEPGYGEWTVPGGAVEIGETVRDAASREVAEECGLLVKPGEVIDVVDRIVKSAAGKVHYHYVLIDFLAQYVEGEFQPSSELLAGRWLLPEELGQYNLAAPTEQVLDKAVMMMKGLHR